MSTTQPPSKELVAEQRVRFLERRLAAMITWVEANQPDAFNRGLWDAIRDEDLQRATDEPQPSASNPLVEALRVLSLAFAEGRQEHYGMRIPAEPNRDGDLVCARAAEEIERLQRELDAANDHLEDLCMSARPSVEPSPDADHNAPWLSIAHSLCSDLGIAPGRIYDRMLALSEELRRPAEPPKVAADGAVAHMDYLFRDDTTVSDVRKAEWVAAKKELIASRHGLTAEQVSAARESLLDAVAERVRAIQPPSDDELTAWECRNCGELHRLNEDRCGCGWTRANARSALTKSAALKYQCPYCRAVDQCEPGCTAPGEGEAR